MAPAASSQALLARLLSKVHPQAPTAIARCPKTPNIKNIYRALSLPLIKCYVEVSSVRERGPNGSHRRCSSEESIIFVGCGSPRRSNSVGAMSPRPPLAATSNRVFGGRSLSNSRAAEPVVLPLAAMGEPIENGEYNRAGTRIGMGHAGLPRAPLGGHDCPTTARTSAVPSCTTTCAPGTAKGRVT